MSPAWVGRMVVAALLVVVVLVVALRVWQRTRGPASLAEDYHSQVAVGRRLYVESCANCHEVEAGTGPRLTHNVLVSYGSASALFSYLRRSMPYDTPGSLPDRVYWVILAYLLDSSGLLPPGTKLDSTTAPEVVFSK